MEEFYLVFMAEAAELLEKLEDDLMELKDAPEDKELIDSVFRALHTIKGSSAMFGFDEMANFTHELESIFELVRDGELAISPQLIDTIFESRDQIAEMLAAKKDQKSIDKLRLAKVVYELHKFDKRNADQAIAPDELDEDGQLQNNVSQSDHSEKVFWIRFKPEAKIFHSGNDPVYLIRELEQLGRVKCISHMDLIPGLDELEPDLCYIFWDIILTSTADINEIKDVFIFVEDLCDLEIKIIDDEEIAGDEEYKRLGEILMSHGEVSQIEIQHALARQQPIGKILVDFGFVKSSAVESAIVEQEEVRKNRSTRQDRIDVSNIRVSADKLDTLVDLVGELVVAQAQLTQVAKESEAPKLVSIAEEVERLSGELRDNTMDIRMLPIGSTFSKFKRLIYDLSKELGKDVQLVTEGGETELDKNVIEKLNDPLVHLIRNCIDHGIESPAEREATGKPKQGTVKLSAIHSGPHVFIHIADDGLGLNVEAIRAKGIERGVISADAELSKKEIFGLIMEAGFSTSKEITNVSGRGVGMDVVRRSIEELRGSIEIESTEGEGTVITIQLPLTLAIIEGLQVEISGDYFILPLAVVEECIELVNRDDEMNGGRDLIHVRGEVVPYIRLREWFGMTGERTPLEQIVVTNINDQRIGLVVDHVIGEHQTVIKSLGKVYENVEGISGATIRGDGTIALILDVPKIIDGMEREIARNVCT